jgi:phosphosulfolactate phosphohydrolase-like enzyme
VDGVLAVANRASAAVIVDVLSFSTCVDIATGRGVRVLPYRAAMSAPRRSRPASARCWRCAAGSPGRRSRRVRSPRSRPVIHALRGERSPEAAAAEAAFLSSRDQLVSVLADCASGRELCERGFSDDVALAAELDVSACVPRLVAGAYVRVAG